MNTEFQALQKNSTWTLVPPHPSYSIIGCKWVFKIKRKSDGTIERHKARLVAKGFNQVEGLDYFETFSPVVKPTTIRCVIAIVVINNWDIKQLDVNNAFLNGELQETVHMSQPPGFIDSTKSDYVCRLHKALYGLKQAPRAWFKKLSSSLLQWGFIPSKSDTSMFIYNSSTVIIITLYRSTIGALQYILFTRPDIALSVNKVCQFMHKPTEVHWQAVKRILRYLAGTINHGICFNATPNTTLTAFTDADYASSPDDRRSTGGFCVYLGDKLVSWSCSKQKVVSRSSTESEYRAVANTVAELIWLIYLLSELQITSSSLPMVYCDNLSATYLTANPILHARTKHVEVDHHFIREKVQDNILGVEHVPAEEKIADIFTKPLSSKLFTSFKIKLNWKEQVLEGKNVEFSVTTDGILHYRARLCIPNDAELKEQLLSEAHATPYSVHPGATKMYQDLKGRFWWSGMKKEVAEYVAKCLICQKVKAEHQRPGGELQPLDIPEWKWDQITMDFVVGLPRTAKGHDAIWQLAALYVQEIVRLHGVPKSIVSDRDARFTSKFWKSVQRAMGTSLKFSTAFHPQTDGQSERTIQILEDMLRACVLDFKGTWNRYLPLIEFSYNNSYQATIGMAPYEALYGRRSPEFVEDTTQAVKKIQTRMKSAQSRQKSYADKRRRPLEFQVGDSVFLKVSPFKGVIRFGKRGKLNPRYIGPYEILERVGKTAYRLALPPNLASVHNVFHVSMLKKYVSDKSHVLEQEPIEIHEDLSFEEKPVQILDYKNQDSEE
ncbi:hypothetical protein UlMin_011088 [Ulmus minor]